MLTVGICMAVLGITVDFNISSTEVEEGGTYAVCATIGGSVTLDKKIEIPLSCFPTAVASKIINKIVEFHPSFS